MKITVPATSANLGPGFDTLGIALKLKNETIIKKSKFFALSVRGEGEEFLKQREGNIFLNIFYDVLKELTGSDKTPYKFHFDNKIPISRGLGSSSAVIISAIQAAYEAAEMKISKGEILNKALRYEPHPDNIAPAVWGGFVVSILNTNHTKVITSRHEVPKFLRAVIAIPNKAISTKASRVSLPKEISLQDAVFNISHSSLLVSAFIKSDFELLRFASKDKIHQQIRMSSLPELFSLQKLALENGALMSTPSGSGSTFFNLAYRCDSRHLKKTLSEKFPHYKIEILEFDNEGLLVEKD